MNTQIILTFIVEKNCFPLKLLQTQKTTHLEILNEQNVQCGQI